MCVGGRIRVEDVHIIVLDSSMKLVGNFMLSRPP